MTYEFQVAAITPVQAGQETVETITLEGAGMETTFDVNYQLLFLG